MGIWTDITVYNADKLKSVEACIKLGGKLLKESRNENGEIFYALIENPSGAVVAFMQEQPE